MIDLIFSLGQFMAVTGLLYGVIVTFANWREAGHFWGDCDPILASELRSLKARLSAAPGPQFLSTVPAGMVETFKEAA